MAVQGISAERAGRDRDMCSTSLHESLCVLLAVSHRKLFVLRKQKRCTLYTFTACQIISASIQSSHVPFSQII